MSYRKEQVLLELLLSVRAENIMSANCCVNLSKHMAATVWLSQLCVGVKKLPAISLVDGDPQ